APFHLHQRRQGRDARGPRPRRGAAHRRHGAGALAVLGRHRRAGGPARARVAAPGEPGRRDRRQGFVRGAVHGGRGAGGARARGRAALMHLKRVIPCLDVDAGRVVKGTNFVDIRDAGDPVELAERYDAEGADELVFLDITATHERRDTIVELARRTADNVFIPFTIGGGIRSVEDAQAVLDAGADKVSVNSAALERPDLIDELVDVFGSQCVVIAIDAKRAGAGDGAPGLESEPTDRLRSCDVYVEGGRRLIEGREAVAGAGEATGGGAGAVLRASTDRGG